MALHPKTRNSKRTNTPNVMENKSFYIISTSENREFKVRSSIISTLKGVDIIIPLIKSSVFHKEKEFMIYERVTPDYLTLSFDGVIGYNTNECIDIVSKTEDVLSFIGEINNRNENIPTKLSYEDISDMLKNNSECVVNKNKDIIITNGQYAGFRARILKTEKDYVVANVFVKDNPTILVPIWNIGQEV